MWLRTTAAPHWWKNIQIGDFQRRRSRSRSVTYEPGVPHGSIASRVQAEQAAREGGSVRHASGYDLMLLQLAEDRRRPQGRSVHGEKAEIKVELLPEICRLGGGASCCRRRSTG